jgi:Na+/H+-dicarboxylate symporter
MVFSLRKIHPRSLKFLSKELQVHIEGKLWLKILIGMFLGIVLGIVMGPTMHIVNPETATIIGEWVAFPGLVFLGLLQMIMVPLVFASIIRGIASSENIEQLRKTGTYLVIFLGATTTIAIAIGMFLAMVIGPGHYISSDSVEQNMNPDTSVLDRKSQPTIGNIPRLVGGVIPINPLGSMVRMEMLQVVLFSILLGIAVISIPIDQSKPILDLLGSIQLISIQIVSWAMRLAPIAVFGLIAKLTVKLGFDALFGMAIYVGTVLLGLLTILVVYLIVVLVISGRKPWNTRGPASCIFNFKFSRCHAPFH